MAIRTTLALIPANGRLIPVDKVFFFFAALRLFFRSARAIIVVDRHEE